MKNLYTTSIIFAVIIVLVIAGCSSKKKSTTSAAPDSASKNTPAPAATNTTTTTSNEAFPAGPGLPANPGYFSPGDAELAAIKPKYNDATMETLKSGYNLYTGVCTNCHKAVSIYSRSEQDWYYILDRMAMKARLSPVEKDAVIKYVMAIKATQPK